MMNLQMLVVIGFRGGALATNRAMERPFPGVDAPMLNQIVMPMEGFVALIAGELLVAMMLPPMPHIVVLAYELATTILTGVRFDLLVCIHMVLKVQLTHKCLGAVLALEGFGGAIRMHPRMYFEIPFGGETFVADSTIVLRICRVRCHVRLYRCLGEYLLAHGTLHWLGIVELIRMRQSYMAT